MMYAPEMFKLHYFDSDENPPLMLYIDRCFCSSSFLLGKIDYLILELIALMQVLINSKWCLDYTHLSAAKPKQLQLWLHVLLMKEGFNITFWRFFVCWKSIPSHCFHGSERDISLCLRSLLEIAFQKDITVYRKKSETKPESIFQMYFWNQLRLI